MDGNSIPVDTSIQAAYEDGFVLDETERGDVSLYEDHKNTLYDVIGGLPEAEHGRMVRFSVFWRNQRHDVDWTALPGNARPIRFRHGYSTMHLGSGEVRSGWSGVDFGYQFTDTDGRNVKKIEELR